jgi:hypothetical protein
VTEQLALAKSLKVPDDMVPLLQAGGDAIRQSAGDAHTLGAVMSAQVVTKAAEMGEKFKEANQVISVQMKTAFVALAPEVLAIVQMMAKMATLAADIAWNLGHTRIDVSGGRVQEVTDYTGAPDDYLERRAEAAKAKMRKASADNAVSGNQGYIDRDGKSVGKVGAIERRDYDDARKDWLAIGAAVNENRKMAADLAAAANGGKATALAKEKEPKPKKTPDPAHDVREQSERVNAAMDEAAKSLATANAELTLNIRAHADAEKAAVDAETKTKNDKLDADRVNIDADKKLSAPKKHQLEAELALAQTMNDAAAVAKKTKIDRDAENQIIEQRLAREREINGYAQRILSDAQVFAATSAQRRTLALAALDLQQRQQQSDLAEANRKRLQDAGSDPAAIAAAQAYNSRAQSGLNTAQGFDVAQTLRNTQSPGQAYATQLNDGFAGINDQMQDLAVDGIKSLSGAIDDLALSTKSAKEIEHDFALGIVKDMLSLAEKDLIQRPLANALFPGASGGAAGGAQATAAMSAASALTGVTTAATAAAMALQAVAGSGGMGSAGNAASSAGGAMAAAGGGGGFNPLSALSMALKFLPAFAAGTDHAPGGPSIVGENGPEIRNLGRGDTITNMDSLSRITRPSGLRVNSSSYSVSFDNRGAVMTDDLLRQMNTMAATHSQRAVGQAVSLSRVAARDDLNRRSRQHFGG